MRTTIALAVCATLLACSKKEDKPTPAPAAAEPAPVAPAAKAAAADPAPVAKPAPATAAATPAAGEPAEADVVPLPVSDDDKKASATKLAAIKAAADKKDWKATHEQANAAIGLNYKNYEAWYYKALALENSGKTLQAHGILGALQTAAGEENAALVAKAKSDHARLDEALKTSDATTRGGCRYPVTISRAEARVILRRLSALLSQANRCMARIKRLCDSGLSAQAAKHAVSSCVRLFQQLENLPDMHCKKFPSGLELQMLWILGKAAVAVLSFAELMETIDRGGCG